MLIDILRAK